MEHMKRRRACPHWPKPTTQAEAEQHLTDSSATSTVPANDNDHSAGDLPYSPTF